MIASLQVADKVRPDMGGGVRLGLESCWTNNADESDTWHPTGWILTAVEAIYNHIRQIEVDQQNHGIEPVFLFQHLLITAKQ